ncbi:kinase-like domain-containing protein [Xylaria bambusicola]|uniref:kinase-like domain-containing protein n=1 Tax=Xylaria bambusicola TaxID=326684 RepID=UPI002007D244|nr:kinase-like domain-containing protein [Xylaria bambusicola]KAI0526441.1 kinase-like domain-containing protein [Xylaria bambusicola]
MIQPPTTALSAGPDDAASISEMSAAINAPHSFPAPPSPQPHISIEQFADAASESAPAPLLSTPPAAPLSPLRHHKRTPSQHREVKETLDAKYTNDEVDGISQSTVNQYRIGEEIGRGSYGAVHLATDQFGNEYAVKEFSKSRLRKRAQSHILRRPGPGTPHHQAPGTGLNNFYKKQFGRQEDAEAKDALYLIRAEIAIMKKLNHPNLVALIEVLDDPEDDSLYMVLEMCKKGVVMKIDLDQQATPYESELCRTWFRDLILGIEYLHAQNIIHRDIKPDNLLLTEDDVLKIVDFGVSEMFEKSNEMMTNKSAGSPAFIPPELCQARHGDVSGKAADVWSMGVTLYCLKYGQLPFNGHHVLDMYEAIREKPFFLPEGEDADFADLITRILDKNSITRITLPEIRNHPWVTRNGEDPLLPEVENCSDVVETPNELEVNHAFTRKMDHLICVLKAIRRFKGLISQSRVTTPRTPYPPRLLPKTITKAELPISWPASQQQSDAAESGQQKSVAQEAAELIEQRNAYLRSGLNLGPISSEQKIEPQFPGSTEKNALFLGIGTGGENELSSPDNMAFAESPTGIDFDVYNRAFETEIKRIRSDRKKNRSWTYMTKMLGEKEMDKYVGDDCMIVEAGKSAAAKAQSLVHKAECSRRESEQQEDPDSEGGSQRAVEVAKETGSRLADLVVSLTRDMKEKATTREGGD